MVATINHIETIMIIIMEIMKIKKLEQILKNFKVL